MLIDHPFKTLGYTPIDRLLDFFNTHEPPWKTIVNPYSRRQTLPVLWCDRELTQGKIRTFRLDQPAILNEVTDTALAALHNYVPGIPVRVFYAKLSPHDSILPHIDDGFIFRESHRCHLPIKAPQGIEFRCADKTYAPKEGEWFELNNCWTHSVTNTALSDRLHFIVDVLEPHLEHLLQQC